MLIRYDTFTSSFRSIFSLPSNVPAYFVVGNHDVGLGRSVQFSRRARARFQHSFGVSQTNRLIEFGNHSLALIDAPGLVEEDYRRVMEGKIYSLRSVPGGGKKGRPVWSPSLGGAIEFVKTVAQGKSVVFEQFFVAQD